MHHAVSLHEQKRARNVRRNRHDAREGHLDTLRKQIAQGTARQVFHRQIADSGFRIDAGVIDFDEIRMTHPHREL